MKNCELFWTYVVMNVPFDDEKEHEAFISFSPKFSEYAIPLIISQEGLKKWFWPSIFEYTKEYGIYKKRGQTFEQIFDKLANTGKLETVLCKMLNEGDVASELVRPLEDQALKLWAQSKRN